MGGLVLDGPNSVKNKLLWWNPTSATPVPSTMVGQTSTDLQFCKFREQKQKLQLIFSAKREIVQNIIPSILGFYAMLQIYSLERGINPEIEEVYLGTDNRAAK